MLIMVLALFALAALKNVTLRSTINSQEITEATACAEEQIERFLTQGYDLASSGNGACPDSKYLWTADVTPEGSIDGLKKIVINVEWSEKTITLQTLLGNNE